MGDPVDKAMNSASDMLDKVGTPVANAVTKTGEIDQIMDSDIVQKGFPALVMTTLGQGAAGAIGSSAGEAGFAGEAGGTTGGAGPAATTPGTAAGASAGSSVPVPQAQAASAGSVAAPPTEALGSTPSPEVAGSEFGTNDIGPADVTQPAAVPNSPTAAPAAAPAPDTAKSPSTGAKVLDSLKTAATVLTPAASLLAAAGGLAASKRAQATAGKNVDGTPAPVVAPPVVLPTSGSSNRTGVLSAPIVERTATQDMVRRRGRASTILTDSSDDKLGS